jgi:hypothetical protein
MYRCVFAALLCLPIPSIGIASAATQDRLTEKNSVEAESNLIPPSNLPLYEKPFSSLTEREQWRIRIHGLRDAMLHPSVWGTLKSEQTENRQIVPMKRFFLRSSESPAYRMQTFVLGFNFRKIGPGMIERFPRDNDPLIEIGLGGAFERGEPSGRPLVDRSYVLRISGIPSIPSGLYYRSLSKYVLVSAAAQPLIEAGKRYQLEVSTTAKRLVVTINGARFVDESVKNLDRGLVSVRSGWCPLKVSKLEVAGRDPKGSQKESGLLVPPSGSKKIEPGLLKNVPAL